MGKIVFWVVVVFVLLFALRMWNLAKARSRSRSAQARKDAPQPMVQCVRCGVFLPAADAQAVPGGYRCTDPACTVHRSH
ncbi:MAG: hypothetical protein IT521_01045 [Burkholderiales bacterium]|nr:hypothetical protein [Burkholderiales bacterium]